jgi:hypothetical protein
MNEHSASLLLLLLLSADLAFNGLHIFKHIFVTNQSEWDIRVSAYLEIYHLVKIFWIIVLFVYILKLTRCFGYVSWIMVFTFFLVDDAFLIHQNIGDHISNSLGAYLPLSLSLQSRLFELVALAVAGFILLVILSWAYFRNPQMFRKVSKDMVLFIVALVLFGVIVDLAAAIDLGPAVMFGLDIVEDGGEMVVFSLIIWYVFLLAIRKGKPDIFIHDLLRNPSK